MNKWRKPLTQRELEDIIAHLSESEDELDEEEVSDDDMESLDQQNDNVMLNMPIEFEDGEADNVLLNMPIEFEDGVVVTENFEGEVTEDLEGEEMDDDTGNGTTETTESEEEISRNPKQEAKELKTRYRNIIWRKKNLILDDDAKMFRGITSFPPNILNLSSPLSFFKYFFDDELISKIVNESNLFSVQKDITKPANITTQNINQYLGICIYMSIVHMPDVRSYWSPNLGFDKIKETMSYNNFVKIRRYLHFNNNDLMKPRDHPDHDRLHKLRPFVII